MIFDAPQSVRNNNPGNIRSSKGGFKKFGTPQEGVEAMKNDLLIKVSGQSSAMRSKFGDKYTPTIESVISTWAPETENDTGAYISHVAQKTGIDPTKPLTQADVDAIVPAMIEMEGGNEAVQHFQSFMTGAPAATNAGLMDKASALLGEPSPAPEAEKEEKDWATELGELGATFTRQGLQGMTAGFGDEITDPLAAGAASLITGEPYEDMLSDARALSKTDLENDWAEHPIVSAGANIGGGVLTGGAVAGGLKTVAPKAVSALETFARSNPAKAAALTGAGWGGVSGAGTSDGPMSERLVNAGDMAMWGVPLGVAGYSVAKNGGNAINALAQKYGPVVAPYLQKAQPAIDKAKSMFGGGASMLDDAMPANAPDDLLAPAPAAQPSMPPINPMTLAGILDEDALATLEQGRTIPLTKGDRTQNVVVQRQEQIAAENASEPMLAARAQQQTAARKPFENVLGVDIATDPVDLRGVEQAQAEAAAKMVRGNFDALKGRENAAWEAAREGAEGVGIRSSTVQDGLSAPIDGFLKTEAVRKGDIPKLDGHLDDLNFIISQSEGKDFKTATQLKALDDWKKRLNRTIGNTMEPADKRILENVARRYENFMANVADDAIVNGDIKAIKAFREARDLSKEKFNFYDSDSAITRILDTRDLSGEQLVNVIMGAEKLAGKGDNGRLVETMLTHAGDRAPEMQEALKKGIMAKALRRSITSTPDPADTSRNLVSFANMRKEIGDIIGKKELFSSVFNETEQSYMRQLYDDLNLVAGKQKGAINNSSTGVWTADMISGLGKMLNNPLFRATPVMGAATNALDGAMQKQAAAIVTGKAEKGLDEFILDQINQIDARPAFYGAISANSVGPDGILRVTVRPNDKDEKEKK